MKSIRGNTWLAFVVTIAISFCSGRLYAGQLGITDITDQGGSIGLSWTGLTDRCIVQSSTSITGIFQNTGPVLEGNETAVSNQPAACFFRLRHVTTVPFSDRNFEQAVRSAIPFKYEPSNSVYDLDLAGVTGIDASSLSVTNTTQLHSIPSLQTLSCQLNQITDINLTSNRTALYVDCSFNQLTNLDVTTCTNLSNLFCNDNQLSSLNFGSATSIVQLVCGNNSMTNLDAARLSRLIALDCGGNQITAMNPGSPRSLAQLSCQNNQLTNLDAAVFTNLTYIDCSGNWLTSLKTGTNRLLHTLYCGDNLLTNLNVSACTNLRTLVCWNNQLETLDISGNTNLTSILAMGNPLTNIAVWWNPPSSIPPNVTLIYDGTPDLQHR